MIENGSLKKYTGTEVEVVIPDGVTYISIDVLAIAYYVSFAVFKK